MPRVDHSSLSMYFDGINDSKSFRVVFSSISKADSDSRERLRVLAWGEALLKVRRRRHDSLDLLELQI